MKKPATRLLALDYGLKRIGIALCDESKSIASPLPTLQAPRQEKQVALAIAHLVSDLEKELQCRIEEIIVGLPLMMSGKGGFLADEVHSFCEELARHVDIPLKLWDERLSTVQAERTLREVGFSRKKRSQRVDAAAAVVLLQSYLDYKASLMEGTPFPEGR